MENQPTTEKRHKIRRYIILAIVVIIAAFGIYFYYLVRQNVININSQGATNIQATGDVATQDDPYLGGEDAAVVIVEFSDFQCPYCFQSFPVVRELINYYGNEIKIIYRDFPDSNRHHYAQKAAEAGECAQEQGKFWEMHDKMFINQSNLSTTALKQYAQEIGLNTNTFSDCLDSGKYEAEVLQDFNDGYYAGVDGTPTFFINNHEFEGATTLDNFKGVIDGFLALSQ